MTSSMLAFSDDETTQKRVFKVVFLHLFEVNDQNKLQNFKDHIFFLKMVSFVIFSHRIIL